MLRRPASPLGIRHRNRIRAVVARPAALATSTPPRVKRFAPAERNPAVHRSAIAERRAPAGASHPRDHRRRPRGMRRHASRAPAPAPAEPDPASVMRRGIAPRRRVDPRVAPTADARPVAVAVRRPARHHFGREPDVAVVGIALPRAVMIEIGIADHFRRHVAGRRAAFVVAIAIRAPRVERIARHRIAHIGELGLRADQDHRLSGQCLLDAAGECDLRLAFAHRHRRRRAIRRHVDAVEARPHQPDLRVRRVDARAVTRGLRTHAHEEPPLCDEKHDLAIVEARHVDVRVAAHAELPAAVIDLGATVAADPQVVAGRDGIVEADRRPLVGTVLGREKDVAREFGNARDAGGQFIFSRRLRRRGQGNRCEQQ